MPTRAELLEALKRADAAGDDAAARAIAKALTVPAEQAAPPDTPAAEDPAQPGLLESLGATGQWGGGATGRFEAPTGPIPTLPSGPVAPSTSAYLADQIKRGPVQVPALLDMFAGSDLRRGMDRVAEHFLPVTPGKPAAFEGVSLGKPVAEATGFQNLAPPDTTSKVLGEGVAALTDPASYLFPGGSGIARLFSRWLPSPVAQVAGRVPALAATGAQSAGVAMGAAAGADAARNAVGTPTAEVAGALAGGAGVGLAQAAIRAGLRTVVGKAMPGQLTDVQRMLVETSTNKELERVVGALQESDPGLYARLEAAVRLSERMGFPLPAVAAAGNKGIESVVADLAAVNPAAGAAFRRQFTDAREALDEFKARFSGFRPGQAGEALAAADQRGATALMEAKVEARKARIDSALEAEVARALKGGETQAIGERIRALVDAKESAVKRELSPRYEAFLAEHDAPLPPEAAASLKESMDTAVMRDIFKQWSREFGALREKLGLFVGKEGEQAAREFTLRDLDSLKRAVNKVLRSTTSTDKIDQLTAVKRNVQAAIGDLPEETAGAYRALDKEWAQRVGLPFDTAGINAIDRAKFDSSIAPMLTRNAEAAQHFVDAAGPEGAALLGDALMSGLRQEAFRGGQFRPDALRRWLSAHGDQVKLVPGLRDDLRTLESLKDRADLAKQRMDARFAEYTAGRIATLSGYSAEEIGQRLMKPEFRRQVLKTFGTTLPVGKQDDVVGAARKMWLDYVSKSQNPQELLNSEAGQLALRELYGPEQQRIVADIMDTAQRLRVDPSDIRIAPKQARGRDWLERIVPGLTAPILYSNLRDRIASVQQKVFRLGSRMVTAQAQDASDQALIRALADPEAARTMQEMLKKYGTTGGTVDPQDTVKMMKGLARAAGMPLSAFAEQLIRPAAVIGGQAVRGQAVSQEDVGTAKAMQEGVQ